MKSYYLVNGNKIEDIMVSFFEPSIKGVKDAFEERKKEFRIPTNDWLVEEIIELSTVGLYNVMGDNKITTILLNNKPVKSYINLSMDRNMELIKEYAEKEDDYRHYTVVVNKLR